MYVILPASYKRWATDIVLETEKPSFKLASCCNVEVVNGAEGDLVAGFFCTSPTLNVALMHAFNKSEACVLFVNCFDNSALIFPFLEENIPFTLKKLSVACLLISFSRSTINRTATD